MKQRYVSFTVGMLMFLPLTAYADADTEARLTLLYSHIIALLQQQIGILVDARMPHPALAVESPRGTAPYTVLFSLGPLTGTEALDFGDGHSTGSNGCILNARGFCDLRRQIVHTYQFPGTYTAMLYVHDREPLRVAATTSITVIIPPISPER